MPLPLELYRVGTGETARATQLVDAEFGTNIGRMGGLTDEETRASTDLLNETQQQLENVKIYTGNFQKIIAIKVQIEELRKRLLTAGLEGQKEIGKMIATLLVEQAKHEEAMNTMGHKAGLDVRLAEMKGVDNRERNLSIFEMKLQRVAQLGASKLEDARSKFQQQDEQMAQSRQQQDELAQRRSQRTNWLTGRSNDRPDVPGNGSRRNVVDILFG